MDEVPRRWAEEKSPAVLWYLTLWSLSAHHIEPVPDNSSAIKADGALILVVTRDLNDPELPSPTQIDYDLVEEVFLGEPVKRVFALVKWLIEKKETSWGRYEWLRLKASENEAVEAREEY